MASTGPLMTTATPLSFFRWSGLCAGLVTTTGLQRVGLPVLPVVFVIGMAGVTQRVTTYSEGSRERHGFVNTFLSFGRQGFSRLLAMRTLSKCVPIEGQRSADESGSTSTKKQRPGKASKHGDDKPPRLGHL